MSRIYDPPVSAGSEQAPANSSWPGPGYPSGPAAYGGSGGDPGSPVRRPRRRVLAAGVAVALALGTSWGLRGAGITAGAKPPASNYVIEGATPIKFTDMGSSRARCTAAHVATSDHLLGRRPFRRRLDNLPQRLGRDQQPGPRRPRPWPAADQSDPDRSASRAGGARPPGLRGAITASGIACRTARRSSGTHLRTTSFVQPAGRARQDIRTLACVEWATEGSIQSTHGGCLTNKDIEHAHHRYTPLIPEKDRIFKTLGIGPGSRAGEMSDQLRKLFRGNTGMTAARIRVSGRDAGVSIPARICGAGGTAGGSGGEISSGDRASLPGRSTRYRVVWLVCVHCGATEAWSFYDERDIPVCANPPHCRMELQR
jgi:hypothetical protein